jgi:hypothetical protein
VGELADDPTRSRRLPAKISEQSFGSPASARSPNSFR